VPVCLSFDANTLQEAICATFTRRGTPIPQELPPGLSAAFALDDAKMAQWKAFLSKNKLQAPPLDELVNALRPLLMGKNTE